MSAAASRPGVPAPLRGLLALSAACAVALLASPGAVADVFSSPSLVSYGVLAGSGFVQQAEYAHDSAISGDGRYVVFDGSVGGVTGVWRRDLATGTLEQVAGGDAAMPSISEDGRYVSFTTNEGGTLPEITHAQPDDAPRTEAVNVYRRDMDNQPASSAAEEAARPPSERAFRAASVPSGSEEALRYAEAGSKGGSYAAGRTAMSANGNEVAFVTSAVSNLVAYPALEEAERDRGETPLPHAPADQVALHRFDTGVTELVSRCRAECGQGAAAGAAEPVVFSKEAEGKPVGAARVSEPETLEEHPPEGAWPGASVSADGSTVAWIGQSLAEQAVALPGEHIEAEYAEPLWRRLPAAANQTRRVTGGSDPEAPGCAASGEQVLGFGSGSAADPCQGPFLREHATVNACCGLIKAEAGDVTPRLSRTGEEVAFVANARLLSEGEDFRRGEGGNPADLFVASMAGGLTRTQALTPLTQAGASEAESAEIGDFEISPDGQQVAFSTIRELFVLGWPTLVSAPVPQLGISELYDADLADGTLTRVTHGYGGEGEQSEQPHRPVQGRQYGSQEGEELGALTPDFSASGDQLVFTSTAANLVYGDGNSPSTPVTCCKPGDGSDVFAVTRAQFDSEDVAQSVSAPPATLLEAPFLLSATAQARRDGSVVVYARVPAAGRLRVAARAALVTVQRRRAHGHWSRREVVTTKTVGESLAGESDASGGLLEVVVRLRSAYAALAGSPAGLPAELGLTFASPGRKSLTQAVAIDFKRAEPRRKGRAAGRRRTR